MCGRPVLPRLDVAPQLSCCSIFLPTNCFDRVWRRLWPRASCRSTSCISRRLAWLCSISLSHFSESPLTCVVFSIVNRSSIVNIVCKPAAPFGFVHGDSLQVSHAEPQQRRSSQVGWSFLVCSC